MVQIMYFHDNRLAGCKTLFPKVAVLKDTSLGAGYKGHLPRWDREPNSLHCLAGLLDSLNLVLEASTFSTLS